jgi:serine/threonine protein kinase
VDLPPDTRSRFFAERGIDERHPAAGRNAARAWRECAPVRGISVAAIRALPYAELLGLQCGPYRLLEIIGRGGMGTVYIGESIGDEVSQRVAVKLLNSGDVPSRRRQPPPIRAVRCLRE